jgi:hypothetical protein
MGALMEEGIPASEQEGIFGFLDQMGEDHPPSSSGTCR